MHALLFSLKRAHQRSLAVGRDLLTPFGLTPARFDMLHAIHSKSGHACLQSELRRLLGVTAATVSRMLKSLEILGFLTRHAVEIDTRQRRVRLTPTGIRVYRRARYWTIGTGAVELMVTCAIAITWYSTSAFLQLLEFDEATRRIRDAFRDSATLYYQWHPDD